MGHLLAAASVPQPDGQSLGIALRETVSELMVDLARYSGP
jgi:hypothetical protein